MKLLTVYLLTVFIILTVSSVFAAEKVTIFTEEFPPFQYTENGKIIGASAEIVDVLMKKASISYEMKSYPWARSYKNIQKKSNALIFSISRRVAREDLFKWIGIIVPSRNSVFALKNRSDIKISSLEAMKKYKIGTTIEDARESYLVNKGFVLDKLDRTSGNTANNQNYKKLKIGRIDLWPMPDAVAFHISRAEGDDPNVILQKVFLLEEISKGGYYIAASLKTSDTLVQKLSAVLEAFKKTDEYNAILSKWGIGE